MSEIYRWLSRIQISGVEINPPIGTGTDWRVIYRGLNGLRLTAETLKLAEGLR
jgi:hypothetical protein